MLRIQLDTLEELLRICDTMKSIRWQRPLISESDYLLIGLVLGTKRDHGFVHCGNCRTGSTRRMALCPPQTYILGICPDARLRKRTEMVIYQETSEGTPTSKRFEENITQ